MGARWATLWGPSPSLAASSNPHTLPPAGDASESGLIKAVQVLHDIKSYRAAWPKIFEIKFNSTNKWQLSIHKNGTDPSDTSE